MSCIRVLPEAVASRIAAGEVVERPASIVKELVENALDAGARRVDITLDEGGRRLVRVVDDGSGMDRDDALLAFEQHATSKVDSDFDLAALNTFGFRGEALPAIASCSRLTLVTATADGEGTRVRVEHGVLKDVESVGAPKGTSIEVASLFKNQPARRKFLRTSATELSHCVKFIEQQAIARPDVHWTLTHDRPLLELPAVTAAADRIAQLLGQDFADAAMHVSGERDGVRVEGWLVRSGTGSGRFGRATILVNGRAVTDRVLSHALREAAQKLFGVDKTPAGVLMVEVPPGEVDVNVHPAKREVRFAKPWAVHDAVRDAIRGDAFARGFFGPAVDLSDAKGRLASLPGETAVAESAVAKTAASASRATASTDALRDTGPAVHDEVPPRGPRPWEHEPRLLPGAVAPANARPYEAPSPAAAIERGPRVLGQHRNTFIVLEDEQGLIFIDQHCAHERILFERIQAALETTVPRQALLEPVVVELPRRLVPVVEERLEDLAKLGFEAEAFGESSFAIRTIPEAAGKADPAELLRELAAQDVPGEAQLRRVERLAATIACKAAVKAGFPLGHERMRWIADELWKANVPTTCPHGRVALLRISDRDLDHRFGRI